MSIIRVHPEIDSARHDGRAVVALESAVITAGLPKEPVSFINERLKIAGWADHQPVNFELARAMERAVRKAGAVPATVAVIDRRIHIGLDAHELERLALDPNAGKASATDLARVLLQPEATCGTTVSGTLSSLRALAVGARPAQSAGQTGRDRSVSAAFPICVFATGGIGGVHRDWQRRPDVSADLHAIASTPVCVVCSGGKSILDLPTTLEALEALNVPVLGYRTHLFPQFQSIGTTELRVRLRTDSAEEAAEVCRVHWKSLGQSTGIVLAQPVAGEFALDSVEMTLAVEAAEREAAKCGIIGSLRTPFLLNEIARLTQNKSLESNLALLVSNAQLAAEVACSLVGSQA